MIVRIQKFVDGRETYSTPGIGGILNGQEPIEVKEVEINDTDAQTLFDNPVEYKLEETDGNYKLVKK